MSDPSVSDVPRRSVSPERPFPWRLITAIVAVVVIVGLVVWMFTRPASTTVAPTPSTSPTAAETSPSASAPATAAIDPVTTSAAPPATTEAAGRLAECQPMDASGFVPTRFQMERPAADERVLSLGLDGDGAIAAPPKNEPRTASWWNQGPRPGSDAGKAVMSIHTYRSGGALGNEMYDGDVLMEPGDLITLTDDNGRKACYEFVEATKVWVDDYDPDSDVMVDFAGDPMLAIVICWDFVPGSEDWDSRIFFYATPVSL